LEQFLLKTEEIDDGFRFWITAEPNPGFPIGLLQMSIKFTNEAPVGMRAGLKRSYAWINQDMLDSVPRQEWRQLLYVQCFLHSVTQERRKFGPIGWSVPYEFNQGDLTASVNFIQNHLAEMDTKKSKEVTWSTVRYMVSEIQYGGRITDDWDRVLMSNYTEKYFFQGVLSETYKFYPLPGYTVPQGLELAVFKNHIENMPPVDNPEIFGLHMNADLTYRMQQTQELTLTIMETQPKQAGAGGGKTREEIVNDMAGDMLGKMPKDFNLLEVREYIAKQGATNPLNIFLRQECERFRNISLTTRNTLKDLQLAIAGTIALNSNLINALDALFDALVPASWLKISWASPTLGLWFAGLLARDEQLQKWVFQGRPKTFWLTGWFNAQGFLTAMQQEVSRKHQGWALDDVVIFSEVQKMENDDVKEGPAEGVYINGLFLEGCAWSKKDNKLVDSSPKVLYHALPVLFVTAVLGDSGKEKKNTYNCPVYTTKRRGGLTFIAALGLRSEDTQMKWILRGVGLLCSKD
jgi:dynein heavy chain